jgi:hypothetical protein
MSIYGVVIVGFPTNYKSGFISMFSLPDMRLKYMLTVMTSPPMHSITVHIETDEDINNKQPKGYRQLMSE